MYDEELMLADVMEAVDEYLLEAGANQKYSDKKFKEALDAYHKSERYNALAKKWSSAARKSVSPKKKQHFTDLMFDANDKRRDRIDQASKLHRESLSTNSKRAGFEYNSARKEHNTADRHESYIKGVNAKENFKDKVKAAAVKNYNDHGGYGEWAKKNVPVKESVDDLRLRVYEAAEAGIIDDDEKSTMLEYLNLDNYE